jgi:hypothetical protein
MRASFIDSKLNAMIEGAFDKIFTTEVELIDYLNDLQRAQIDSTKIEQNR